MSKFAAILFGLVVLVYIGVLVAGLLELFPWGLIGLGIIGGFVFLFGWVVRERLRNEKDDYYDKNVKL